VATAVKVIRTPPNKTGAGCGRRWRPSTQPAGNGLSLGGKRWSGRMQSLGTGGLWPVRHPLGRYRASTPAYGGSTANPLTGSFDTCR